MLEGASKLRSVMANSDFIVDAIVAGSSFLALSLSLAVYVFKLRCLDVKQQATSSVQIQLRRMCNSPFCNARNYCRILVTPEGRRRIAYR